MPHPDDPPKSLAAAFELAASLDAPLNERIACYAKHSRRLNPKAGTVYDEAVERLLLIEDEQLGPKIGDEMPDFLLPDEAGALVSLAMFLSSGPLVININRGHWCPYCRLDLRDLAQVAPEIRGMGGQIISIMPEIAHYTKQAIAANKLPFSILTDMDLGYLALLGLMFWIGEDMQQLYRELNLALARFQGNGRLFLPITAKFIVDTKGVVRAKGINLDFRQRMDSGKVLAAVRELAHPALGAPAGESG